jgi:hypothetical protein
VAFTKRGKIMPEIEKKGALKGWLDLINSLLSWIPKDLKELTGFFAGFVMLILIPTILIAGGVQIFKWVNRTNALENTCWKLQSLEGRVFKVNSCTGEVIEIQQSKQHQRGYANLTTSHSR